MTLDIARRRRPWAPLLLALVACSEPPAEVAAPVELSAETLAERRGAPVDPSATLRVIAFGSCNRSDLPQPLWEPISALEPDLWVWLGDNVYADTGDMSVMRAKYEAQLAKAGYAALRSQVPVIGTWDDHDYGANDAGNEYVARAHSQQELLDFLGEPADSPRRTRAGVYTSYEYGVAPRKVKVILLDTRYHRDEPGEGATILGEEQWAWLEAELTNSDAQLHLIGGGFQFLPVDHPFEKWHNFGDERSRLARVIVESGAPGVILLSGDRHISEVMRVDDPELAYPLHEVTSSGMTHSWLDNPGEANRFRVGELYTDLSFGVVRIDWEAGTVDLELRDREGAVAVGHQVRLEELGAG